MFLVLITPFISFAHPGRTDASGCHTCRTNCASWGLSTGEYHCHRSKGVTQPTEPIRSIRNENGVGTTVPAPEYKVPITNTVKPQMPTETAPTEKIKPTPIVKPDTEIKKDEEQIMPSVINEAPSRIVVPTSPVTEIKKTNIIKRFFSWLF